MELADTADRDDKKAACCSFSSLPLLHLVSDTPHHKTLHGTSRPLHNEVLMETVYHQTVIVCFSTSTRLKDVFLRTVGKQINCWTDQHISVAWAAQTEGLKLHFFIWGETKTPLNLKLQLIPHIFLYPWHFLSNSPSLCPLPSEVLNRACCCVVVVFGRRMLCVGLTRWGSEVRFQSVCQSVWTVVLSNKQWLCDLTSLRLSLIFPLPGCWCEAVRGDREMGWGSWGCLSVCAGWTVTDAD